MARITVEDCILKIPNRFDLVLLAAQRARDLSAGAPLTLDRDNDKNPVVALREIADETLSLDSLNESLILNHQRHRESDEVEDEDPDFLALGDGFGAPAQAGSAADRSLVDQEIEDDLLTVGEDAVGDGAEIADVDSVEEDSSEAERNED